MLGVAMISKWHVHAEGYARDIQQSGDARVACVWDEDAARGKAWAESLGVPFEASYDAVLQRPDVDAVLIDAPTNAHKQLMVQAARAGKHIFTEKCMCLTTADCDEVIAAVEKAGVVFTISFPQRCFARNLLAGQCIADGLLGDVTVLRIRNAHDGALAGWLPNYWYDPETTGGGAMMDLGAHPMYLASWLLGRPAAIQSQFTNMTGRAVDDNAVSLLSYANGAVVISETSLVSPMTPTILEVYGTKGVLLMEGDAVRLQTSALKADAPGGWITPKLPQNLPMPLRQWIDSITKGAPVRFGLAEGRALTEIMEAAYIASREKRTVTL